MPIINIDKRKQDIIAVRMFKGKPHIFKRLTDPLDISYLLEMEVSRRMTDCDQIYKVLGIVEEMDIMYIVSEYIEGKDFAELFASLSEQKLLSIVCQILFLIYLLHVSGISHNDLHCGNIRIQPTQQKTIEYFYENRVYSIPTYGVKAFIIDFGGAFIMKLDTSFMASSQLFIGDSFMRLDIRYDLCRFLKSFADCIAWKTNKTKCKKLIHLIEKGLTIPLKLGVYGVPDHFLNMAPKMFNRHIKALYPHAPVIHSGLISLLNAWQWDLPESEYSVSDTFNFIWDLDGSKAAGIRDLFAKNTYSTYLDKFVPLVRLWNDFKTNYTAGVAVKIVTEFDTNLYIQTPIFIVDWILTASYL